MKLYFDTSVLIDLERQREATVTFFEDLPITTELWVSVVTVAEMLTGPHLRADAEEALLTAKETLGQFVWHNVDGTVAQLAAQLQASLLLAGKRVEFQDVLIAAGAMVSEADALITENKSPFTVHRPLAGKVLTVREFGRRR